MIDVKVTGMNRAKIAFAKLADKASDMRPVFKEFLRWYKTDYTTDIFNSRGKALGTSWPKYSLAYLKQKRKSGKPMMRLTNALFDAARGDSGWIEKLKRKTFSFGISDSIKYAANHQYGDTVPQRAYVFTKDGDLSPRAWTVLMTLLENDLEDIK
jgi:hypothetical protein